MPDEDENENLKSHANGEAEIMPAASKEKMNFKMQVAETAQPGKPTNVVERDEEVRRNAAKNRGTGRIRKKRRRNRPYKRCQTERRGAVEHHKRHRAPHPLATLIAMVLLGIAMGNRVHEQMGRKREQQSGYRVWHGLADKYRGGGMGK